MSEEQKLTGSPAARGRNALVVLLPLCLAFGALYRQMPLFTSNQNTKFLHGAANAHWRFLADDWTARTVDPLPVFSWCAEFVFRLLPVQFFLILFSLLIALYAFAMVRIAEKSAREAAGGTAWALFAALFAALHFTPLNKMLLEGVARQYVLGSYLQPSTFGILIYVAILLFLHGRDIVGVLCLVGATLLHPGAYTIVSLLVLAVALHTNSAGAARRRAALPALLFLLCVLPLGVYYVAAFRPSSPESWRLAADILAHERIPHHTQIMHWLTYKEVGRMLFSATVCWSMRHNRLLFRLQLSLIAFAVLSTLLAYLLQNSALLLLAPWRVTAILLPLSFALAAHRLGVRLARSLAAARVPDLATRGLCLLAVTLLSLYSAAQTIAEDKAHATAPGNGVIRQAREQAAPGQLYLLPVRVADFERFRLESGVPILANWKTHPYHDTEVIEWHKRIALADALYNAKDMAVRNQAAQRLITGHGVTHLVLPRETLLSLDGVAETFSDDQYRIYAVAP